jgi:hypothetical protein
MSAGKRHKSPNTGKWEKCTTENCPFGDISAAAYAKLLPLVKREDLPVATHLKLSRIDTAMDEEGHGEFQAIKTDEPMRIAPRGYTAARCGSCDAYLPEGYWEAAQPNYEAAIARYDRFAVPCPNPECRDKLIPTDCQVDVAASDAKYWTDDIAVRRDHWFHVTTKENWLEGAATGGPEGEAILVHVGSRASALDRMRDLMHAAQMRQIAHEQEIPTFYLYEVEVDAAAPISPHVMEDAIEGWPTTELVEDPETQTNPYDRADAQIKQAYQLDGITRYLNACEAPGTISLMANAKRLRQVAVHEIPIS